MARKSYQCPTCRRIYVEQGGRMFNLMTAAAGLGLALGVLAGVTVARR